jgi:hypothetical protein
VKYKEQTVYFYAPNFHVMQKEKKRLPHYEIEVFLFFFFGMKVLTRALASHINP